MATAQELLQKANARKKSGSKDFSPQKKRPWDYLYDDKESKNSTPCDNGHPESEKGAVARKPGHHNNETNSNDKTYGYRNEYKNEYKNEKGIESRNGNKKTRNEFGDEFGNEQKGEKGHINLKKMMEIEATSIESKKQEDSRFCSKSEVQGKTDIVEKLRRLEGHQKNILLYVIKEIKNNSYKNTINIGISGIERELNIKKDVIRTSIKRLYSKMILQKIPGEKGRQGLTRVMVPEVILDECLKLEKLENLCISGNKNENRNEYAIYSSSYNKKTTTTVLPENWRAIDTTALSKIGFSKMQLQQLYDCGLSEPSIIQESINHFAFGLEYNQKLTKYSDPLNVLMGVLRKGHSWIEPGYRSPQEIAMEQLVKQKEEERERILKLEEKLYQLAFEEWQSSLSEEQLENIAALNKAAKKDIIPENVRLSLYFKNKIWPGYKKTHAASRG